MTPIPLIRRTDLELRASHPEEGSARGGGRRDKGVALAGLAAELELPASSRRMI